ncbi:PREDICTED: G-protein coupled receptor 35-like, partial [Ficedula albicollis]|uniref:G-protein coupled receptor 35-like n=1 Tax=Ficedula albicollis TaxID=59894 RepID=UPI0007AD8547
MNVSNNCSSTNLELHHHVRLIELALYSFIFFFGALFIFFFGALFNVLAFWVFSCKMKKWTETRVYVMNLVFADFSVICTLPSMVYLLWSESARGQLCQFTEMMYFINMLVSIYSISFISIDRYIAIKHPLKARSFRSPGKAALLCGLLWLLVVSSATIQLWQGHPDLCLHTYTPIPAALSLLAIFFVFILPLATLTFCSTAAIRNLKKHLNSNSAEEKSIQKAVHIISANLIVFLVCFLPACLGLLARFVMERVGVTCSLLCAVKNLSSVTRCIATSNCCLDSVCYYFVTREFHEAFLWPKASTQKPE